MKKLACLIISFVMCLPLCSCDFAGDFVDMAANDEAKPKTFDMGEISIELTTDFLQMDFISEDYEFIVGTETLTIMGSKVDNEGTDLSDLTVLEFAQYFRQLMEDSNPTEITTIDGIPTMQYTTSEDGVDQTAMVTYHKSSDTFWILCFVTKTENFSSTYDDICKYAKTVKCK